jgi:hypothetical protein
MIDAVDAYLTQARPGATPSGVRVLEWLLRYVCDLVGPYRVLAEVEDDELTVALSVLREVTPPTRTINARDVISAWSHWCRSAGLPAPRPIPRNQQKHLHIV